MPEEKINYLVEQLSELLGRENLFRENGSITVRPASAAEVAAVMKAAGLAGAVINAGRYYIGPAVCRESSGGAVQVIISLERMNSIRSFDAKSRILLAGPATAISDVINAAAKEGLYFPAIKCRHEMLTVGEGVVACFADGMPDFKCQSPCLCGIELVAFDGQVVKIEGHGTGELENCGLTYIMSGHRENPAVITGIYLKAMPSLGSELYLVAAFANAGAMLKILPFLSECREDLSNILAFSAGVSKMFDFPGNDFKRLLSIYGPSGLSGDGVYVIFYLKGDTGETEKTAEKIANSCYGAGTGELLIASSAYQREKVASLINSLWAGLDSSDLIKKAGLSPEQEFLQDGRLYNIAAISWDHLAEQCYTYYGFVSP